MKKHLISFGAVTALLLGASSALAEGRLDTVKARGSLLCSGHNGSYLGFAEVDDAGAWKGLDIDLCRALTAAIFGSVDDHLQIVPISWAQRWPALQAGDIDVLIKASGWTQSRDTELNLAISRPYFIGAFQVMAHADLGAKSLADFEGGTICTNAGTSTERSLATYLESNKIDAEVLVFEKSEETRASYFENRCDAYIGLATGLAAARSQAENPADHVILPEVVDLEAEAIMVPEGDDDWLDVQNWMLSSLWYAEQEGITQANVDEIKANPPTLNIAKFLGVEPGYGQRLGLSDDFAYSMIKAVGNYGEIFDRNMGKDSPYKLERGVNALYSNGGLHYPLIID